MVRLNRRARTLEADTLNDIRIERALEQPLDLAFRLTTLRVLRQGRGLNPLRFGLEDVDERVADDLALLFGVLDALEAREEEVGRVDNSEVHAEMLVQHLMDLLRFIETKDAVVDHNRMETACR